MPYPFWVVEQVVSFLEPDSVHKNCLPPGHSREVDHGERSCRAREQVPPQAATGARSGSLPLPESHWFNLRRRLMRSRRLEVVRGESGPGRAGRGAPAAGQDHRLPPQGRSAHRGSCARRYHLRGGYLPAQGMDTRSMMLSGRN